MIIYPDEAKLNSPLIFDSHSHYDDPVFEEYLPTLLEEQKNNGVFAALTCAVDYQSSLRTLELCEKYDFLYAALGTHPENISGSTDVNYLYELTKHQKCVAIGEIGLDYHYDGFDRSKQLAVFERQLIISKELDLPVVVHDREAHNDTLCLLKKYKPNGVLHCFSGSNEMAMEILKLGMYIGVGGVVTFKNARKLPEIVSNIPRDRLLIETDCPYLSPEPYRGKTCHSGLIPFTADAIAGILGTTRENVLNFTRENAVRLFNI